MLRSKQPGESSALEDDFENHAGVNDAHPIRGLMQEADRAWNAHEEGRSRNFKEAVIKYRSKYGRHPPPGFRDWYRFARERNVHNIDAFEQIMDDLRPFWGVEPATIRSLAAHMSEDESAGVSGLHIRDRKIWKLTNPNWRIETFATMVEQFVEYLPDMDIAMNRLDQPRVVVPWDDMQALLKEEEKSRRVAPEVLSTWTANMSGFLQENDTNPMLTDPQWFSAPGQQYMLIAKEGCPPESHVRNESSTLAEAEALYKDPQGGFITNFNRSSDLCTIGPEIQDKHGFLYAASSILASKKLLPIFGECKVNVNNDILFPANMYYANDERYVYNSTFDYNWSDKADTLIWRGVTSGGTNTADNWSRMHRQRLVQLTNSTIMADKEVRIMTQTPSSPGGIPQYTPFRSFNPSVFASQHTDVGFTEPFACVPDCDFYSSVWTYKEPVPLGRQFAAKYAVDVDGHSFSGRWHAFLQSRSMGIKSTIFREWHDERLWAWRHFAPLDNRFDELYGLLTYFIGLGRPGGKKNGGKNGNGEPYVQRHDFEARKLGRQGREWAEKVLRREDLEVSSFFLSFFVSLTLFLYRMLLTRLLIDLYVPPLDRVRKDHR